MLRLFLHIFVCVWWFAVAVCRCLLLCVARCVLVHVWFECGGVVRCLMSVADCWLLFAVCYLPFVFV